MRMVLFMLRLAQAKSMDQGIADSDIIIAKSQREPLM